MANKAIRFSLIMFLLTGGAFAAPQKKNDGVERLQLAQVVFEEIMATGDKGIPKDLLANSHCIVLIPSVKRAGFVVGGQYGVGVASCRRSDGKGWTGPSTVKMEGGSIGLQIGAGETDVVMMVMNKRGADQLMKSEFTLGGEGAVMAGPIGRAATAETDAFLHAEILSYSRSRGVFAGIALKGGTLRSADDDNKKIYGTTVRHEDILHGRVAPPAAAQSLLASLNKYSRVESD